MVARTPLPVAGQSGEMIEEAYVAGWADLNLRIRRGEPWSGNERNAAFVSVRDRADRLGLVDAAPLLGLDDPGDGRAAARIDIDFDGDDDLVLSQRTAPRLRIMRNGLADGAPPFTFTPPDGAIGEYNGKFMSSQFVLRGSCWLTPHGHARDTYRNFFPPASRWMASGVRLAR